MEDKDLRDVVGAMSAASWTIRCREAGGGVNVEAYIRSNIGKGEDTDCVVETVEMYTPRIYDILKPRTGDSAIRTLLHELSAVAPDLDPGRSDYAADK